MFWSRFAVFFLCAIVGPFTYIMARFKPFGHSDRVTVGFMGAVALIILGIGVCILIKFYLAGMKTRYSLIKQIVEGVYKVILPTVAALLVCYFFKQYMEQLTECLYVLLPFEAVAIVVNPLPKWAFENNVEGIGEITDKVFSKVRPIKVQKVEEEKK